MRDPSARNILSSESEDQIRWCLECPSFPKLMPKLKVISFSRVFYCLALPVGSIQLDNVARAGMGDPGRGVGAYDSA